MLRKDFVNKNFIYKIYTLLTTSILFAVNPLMSLYIFTFVKRSNFMKLIIILIGSFILLSKYFIGGDGDDIGNYINTFLHFDTFQNVLLVSAVHSGSIDIIFWYLSYFVFLFTNNPVYFLFFWHFISLSLLYYSYNKILSKDAIFAFIIFISTTTFYYIYGNTLRQGFAVSLSVLILYYILNKEIKKAYILGLLSILVHPSSIIVLFAIYMRKFSFKIIYISLFFSLFFQKISILKLLGILFSFVGLSHFAGKAIGYSEKFEPGSIFSFGTLIFFIIILTYVYGKYKLKKEIINTSLIKIYFSYQVIYFLFLNTSLASDRIFSYRAVLDPILLIMLSYSFKQKILIKYFLVFIFMLLNIYYILNIFNYVFYDNQYNLLSLNIIDLFELINKVGK